MDIMPYRARTLQALMAGYERTGVPLVAHDGVRPWVPHLEGAPGSYYFIPLLTRWTGVPLEQGIVLFYGALIAVSYVLGLAGAFLLFRSPLSRAVAAVALTALALVTWWIGDIYVAYASVAMAVVPLFLFLLRRGRFGVAALALMLAAGAAMGVANGIRIHAGTGVFVLVAVMTATCARFTLAARGALLLAAALGLLASRTFYETVLERRDAYVQSVVPGYQGGADERTPVWHSMYIGLGYVPNPYGIRYADEVAMERVQEVAPGTPYLSDEYSRVIRGEVLRLVRDDPAFVAAGLLRKTGKVLLWLAVFMNVGVIAALARRKHWTVDLSFGAAIAFAALPGVLVVPALPYLLGALTLATLYAVVSIDHALTGERRFHDQLPRAPRRPRSAAQRVSA